MTNGSNDFGVSFAQIQWIERLLRNHGNIASVTRTQDIHFQLRRVRGVDISLVCLNEYTCGLARVYEVRDTFPGIHIIYVGGAWCSYTREAKEFCLDAQLGLYNTTELNGALHRDDFWAYCKHDENGNPIYPFKAV